MNVNDNSSASPGNINLRSQLRLRPRSHSIGCLPPREASSTTRQNFASSEVRPYPIFGEASSIQSHTIIQVEPQHDQVTSRASVQNVTPSSIHAVQNANNLPSNTASMNMSNHEAGRANFIDDDMVDYLPPSLPPMPGLSDWERSPRVGAIVKDLLYHLLHTIPHQMYLLVLFRLPAAYFSRVARIFERADMSLPEIKRMVIEDAEKDYFPHLSHREDRHDRLISSWGAFVDSSAREWETFNVILVLLMSCVSIYYYPAFSITYA